MPMQTKLVTYMYCLDTGYNSYIFDPRPAGNINNPGYQSHFRNTILNFQTEDRMPVSQLYQPSNPYSRISDHSYMSQSEEELFIEQENIVIITEKQQVSLERQTLGQHSNSMWTKQHTFRLTSSKFGTICRATARKDLSRLAEQLVSPRHFTCRSVQHGYHPRIYSLLTTPWKQMSASVCTQRNAALGRHYCHFLTITLHKFHAQHSRAAV